ncbi:MAG: carotenoid 1,2-hydratase [Gammaproteobacteria bacterium]|nr:carotenoid 1,2-hydratase [Gammaproteobacteria bacterium]
MAGARWYLFALLASLVFGNVLAEDSGEPPSRLADLLGGDADAEFARALTPRVFTFPEDHGPHPEFRNEWWYVTGNLDDEDGRRFGFELTIFRFSLAPHLPASSSAWRTNQVYIAHLAVTDAEDKEFYVAQRYSRGAVGLAGAQAAPFRVWIDDWEMAGKTDSDTWRLRANDKAIGVDLELTALKPPILNGIDGLSQKSADPNNASYYYSITRLQTEGQLRIGERSFEVSGLSWLDREWSTSALAANQVGWDWFALQLGDGSELMYYGLRRTDGDRDTASAGTFIDASGRAAHLTAEDVDITVLDSWESPEGGTYPSRWRLQVPRFELALTVTPVISDQELFTTVRYWEGAVDVEGQHDEVSVEGRGYVELTGYAPD